MINDNFYEKSVDVLSNKHQNWINLNLLEASSVGQSEINEKCYY